MLIFYWSEQTHHWLRDSLQLSWPHVFTLSIIRVGPALDKSWLGYDISHLHPPPPTPPPRVVSVLTACPHAAHCHTATLRLLQKLKSFPQSQDVTHSNSLLGNEKFPILPSCHWPPAGTVLPGQRTLCKYQNINKANRRVKSPIELKKRYRLSRFIPPQFGPLKQNNLIERVTELHPIKQSRLVLLLYFLYFL